MQKLGTALCRGLGGALPTTARAETRCACRRLNVDCGRPIGAKKKTDKPGILGWEKTRRSVPCYTRLNTLRTYSIIHALRELDEKSCRETKKQTACLDNRPSQQNSASGEVSLRVLSKIKHAGERKPQMQTKAWYVPIRLLVAPPICYAVARFLSCLPDGACPVPRVVQRGRGEGVRLASGTAAAAAARARGRRGGVAPRGDGGRGRSRNQTDFEEPVPIGACLCKKKKKKKAFAGREFSGVMLAVTWAKQNVFFAEVIRICCAALACSRNMNHPAHPAAKPETRDGAHALALDIGTFF